MYKIFLPKIKDVDQFVSKLANSRDAIIGQIKNSGMVKSVNRSFLFSFKPAHLKNGFSRITPAAIDNIKKITSNAGVTSTIDLNVNI